MTTITVEVLKKALRKVINHEGQVAHDYKMFCLFFMYLLEEELEILEPLPELCGNCIYFMKDEDHGTEYAVYSRPEHYCLVIPQPVRTYPERKKCRFFEPVSLD